MVLIAIAWLYVVVMVALVEAIGGQGSWLGALTTLLLYGVLPLGIVGYLFFSPARRRVRRAAEAASAMDAAAVDPDHRGHPPGDPIASERKEP